jgi:hypothetical protein
MTEIWKPIDGTNGVYEVSNTGKVRSLNYLGHRVVRELALCFDPKGYLRVALYFGEKRKTQKVHRLVAQAFIPNPDGKPEVNHKDGDKTNNHAGNLEWSTPRENVIHAYKSGLKEKTRAHCKKMGLSQVERLKEYREKAKTPVIAINIATGERTWYGSQHEAQVGTGAPQANIHKVLSGQRKSAHGHRFIYADKKGAI